MSFEWKRVHVQKGCMMSKEKKLLIESMGWSIREFVLQEIRVLKYLILLAFMVNIFGLVGIYLLLR